MPNELLALIGILLTFAAITIASFLIDRKRQGEIQNGL